ncbi:MAG TPA: DinB family protein [Puia sp.]|nr:DinB family protein [Puia sp.]
MDQQHQDLFIKTVLANWELTINRMTTAFDRFSDADLHKPIASGKNRVIYLLGHLVAVHDRMLPLLRLGNRRYPELDGTFITSPDSPEAKMPAAAELRGQWTAINHLLTEMLRAWKPEEWLERHESVSAADFEKEPHRNRLNVVLSRTGHVSYHHGQVALLKL